MIESVKTWTLRIGTFVYQSVRRFLNNNGLLLSAAVSYKILLSFIPLVALLVVGLSFIFPEEQIMDIIRQQVQLHLPAQVNSILEITRSFLESRDVVSGIGLITLLFFSGIGFRVLRDAIKAIFHDQDHPKRRFWISMLLPYLYIGMLGLTLFAITLLSILFRELRNDGIEIFGYVFQFEAAPGVIVSLLTFVSLILIFSSLYKLLPVRSVSTVHSLIGGTVAAVLWDITRRFLAYYFTHVSMTNALYGSIATIVVVLVTLEIAAGIVLYGAQITADLERNAKAGKHWFEPPN